MTAVTFSCSYPGPIRLDHLAVMLPGYSAPDRLAPLAAVPERLTLSAPFDTALAGATVRPAMIRFADRRPLFRAAKVWGGQSASFSSAIGSLCAAAVAREAGVANGDTDRLGLIIGSGLSVLDCAHVFEMRGLHEGWACLDPFRLPHTIPSALGTTIGMTVKARALCHTVKEGAVSSLRAIHQAAVAVLSGRCEAVITGGVEEVSELVLATLVAQGRTNHLGAAPPSPVPHLEGACLGLARRAAPADGDDALLLRGYFELATGPTAVGVGQPAPGPLACDLVVVNLAAAQAEDGTVAPVVASLAGSAEVLWLGDEYGDAYGFAGALALARCARVRQLRRFAVLCFDHGERVGCLEVQRTC